MRPDEREELMHYGIYGMKWGIRRYQNSDGTLTEAGKRRYRTSGNGEFEDEKGEKRYGKDVRKQTKSDAKLEKRKQKAIASGSVDNILKMRSYMTSQELTDAVNRVRNMETLRANRPEILEKEEERQELIKKVQMIGTVATGITNATNAYNGAASIFNVLPFERKLPIVKVPKNDDKKNNESSDSNSESGSGKKKNNSESGSGKKNNSPTDSKTNKQGGGNQSSQKQNKKSDANKDSTNSGGSTKKNNDERVYANADSAMAVLKNAAKIMDNAPPKATAESILALARSAVASVNASGDVSSTTKQKAMDAYSELYGQYLDRDINGW